MTTATAKPVATTAILPAVEDQSVATAEAATSGDPKDTPATTHGKPSNGTDIASLIAALKAKLDAAENGEEAEAPVRAAGDRTASPSSSAQPMPAFASAAQPADPALQNPAPRAPDPDEAKSKSGVAVAVTTATPGIGKAAPPADAVVESLRQAEAKRGKAALAASPLPEPPADATPQTADNVTPPAAEGTADQTDAAATAAPASHAAAAPAPVPIMTPEQPMIGTAAGQTNRVTDANDAGAADLDDGLTRQIDVERDNQWLDRLAHHVSRL